MAATITQSAFGLQAPTNDDTMEISSDFGNADGDIDIDLDSAGEQMQYEDDDQMIDDVKPEAGSYHNDDVMFDGDTASNPGDREMDMQDNPPLPDPDEELLDFSEDEDIYADDAPLAPPAPPAQDQENQHVPTVDESIEQVQSEPAIELLTEGVNVIDHTTQQGQEDQKPQITITPEDQERAATQEKEQPDDQAYHDDTKTPAHVPEATAVQSEETTQTVTEHETSTAQPHVTETAETVDSHLEQGSQQQTDLSVEESVHKQTVAPANDAHNDTAASDPPSDQQFAKPPALTVDTETSKHDDADEKTAREVRPHSPTMTGLHPTVVEYDGNEIYLFPSREPSGSEQYLLENENLVTTSLGDLLQACRSVLGESLSEDEELVLGFEELDLYVSEDSTPAFSTSFSELLDVYLQLHKNDGNNHPLPFRVTLTTKTRFANRLTLITQAISEGKGFSRLSFLQHIDYDHDQDVGFPDEEDFDDDSYQELGHDHDGEQSEQHEQHEQQHIEAAGGDEHVNREPDASQHEQLEQQHIGAGDSDKHADGNLDEPQHEQEHIEAGNATDFATGEQGELQHQQFPQESYEENADAGNQISEYESAQLEENLGSVHPQEETAPAEEAQEETQYHEVEGDGGHNKGNDQDQLGDPPAAAARDGPNENDSYGEDDLANFYDEEDGNSLTPSTASAEGGSAAVQPEDTLAEQSPRGDGAEISVSAVDEHFDDDSFLDEETHSAEEVDFEIRQNEASTTDVGDNFEEVVAKGDEASTAQANGSISDAQQDAGHQHRDQDEHENSGDHSNGVLGDSFTEHRVSEEAEVTDNGGTAANDFDEIDFDDDEEFIEDQSALQEAVETASEKSSPSIKRTYSERNEAEDVSGDAQALKKVRS